MSTNSNQAFDLQVVERRITLPGLKPGLSGLRAVQISDMHMGGFVERPFFEQVMALAAAQKPDLFLLTGDFVYFHADVARGVRDLEATLPTLTNLAPVYAVLGNHDYVAWDDLQRIFKSYGIHELANAVTTFERGGESLYLGGVGSLTIARADLGAVERQIPSNVPAVLMCHEPDLVDETAQTGKFALQISGHSHGGQIVLPIAGRLILPQYARKYPSGTYQVGKMLQYTNRGVGMIHMPIRVDCRPEITVFTFVSAEQSSQPLLLPSA